MIAGNEKSITKNDPSIGGSQDFEPIGLSKIKDVVKRFRVCWEVYPEQALINVVDRTHAHVSRELRKIGISLELYGTPEPGTEDLSPGGHPCRRVQAALKEIADSILPRDERPCRYEVEIDTGSLSYSRERVDRPDVRVTIKILHRNGWDQPIDESEARSLQDMEQALRELGACKGAWTPLSGESVVHGEVATNGR